MDAQSVLSVAKKATVWITVLLAGFASGCATTLPEGGRVYENAGCLTVAFSPDGRYLAGGASTNHQVQVYDASTLRLVKILTLPEAKPIVSFFDALRGPPVAFSNDSTMLAASGIADRTIVWDTATWKEIRQIPEQKRARSIAFAPDGRLLAAAGPDSRIRLWEIDTGTLATDLDAHEYPAYSIAFSPDGELLASSGADSTARIWNRATGNSIQTLRMDSPLVTGVAFSPDGTLLATTAGGYEVKLWKVQTGEAATGITDVQAEKAKQSKSADTVRILSNIGAVLAGMPSLLVLGPRPSQPPGCDSTVVFSPDGRLVATVLGQPKLSGGYHALVANLDTGEQHTLISGIAGCGLAFSPDGKVLAVGSYLGAPNLWDPYTGKKVTLKK
jgi:WD40 repeat protein